MTDTDDIERWDPNKLLSVIGAAESAHKALEKLGENYDGTKSNLSDWGGQTAEAWKAQHGKVRTDITDQGWQAAQVVRALRPLYNEVRSVKSEYEEIKELVQLNGWSMSKDGGITAPNAPKGEDLQRTLGRQQLEARAKQLLVKAAGVDLDIAAALRAITTGGIPTTGHTGQPAPTPKPETQPTPDPKPDESINASGPADARELPLTTPSGHESNVTPATRDPNAVDGPRALKADPHPSPLLAGLSADQWRQRLANYKPGEPLPDPRTPTGDKSIDALAHAAGQQGTTYAWGGNGDKNGPSMGHKATPQEYPGYSAQELHQDGSWTYDDNTRRGYDCGGLVRYAYEQGADFDVGQGTNRIDTNPGLHQVEDAGGIKGAQIPQFAKPGDILIFGGQGDFTGAGTTHTGLYVGNGFFINAPGSGMPVQVDPLRSFEKSTTDILRMPGQ